jgi:hypothetical protein
MVRLDQLPCWKDVLPEEYRRRIAERVAEIESQAALRRQLNDLPAKGPAAILAQETLRSARDTEEVPSAVLPRGEPEDSAGALRGLPAFRGGLPRRCRQSASRRARRRLPGGELPPRRALGRRIEATRPPLASSSVVPAASRDRGDREGLSLCTAWEGGSRGRVLGRPSILARSASSSPGKSAKFSHYEKDKENRRAIHHRFLAERLL